MIDVWARNKLSRVVKSPKLQFIDYGLLAEGDYRLMYYRDADKVEVDIVIESAAGQLVGVQVKALGSAPIHAVGEVKVVGPPDRPGSQAVQGMPEASESRAPLYH